MLTDYYRQQEAFPKSYCSMCLTPSGRILETDTEGKQEMVRVINLVFQPIFSFSSFGSVFCSKVRLRQCTVVSSRAFQVKVQVLLFR